jgi:hypothetical protein
MLGETITAARTVLDRPRPPVYRIIAAGSSDSADVSGRLIDDHGFGVNGDPLQCSSFEDFRARLAVLAQSD